MLAMHHAMHLSLLTGFHALCSERNLKQLYLKFRFVAYLRYHTFDLSAVVCTE